MEVRRAYEWTLLLRPDLDEEGRQEVLKKVEETFKKNEIEVFHRSTLGKRQLAYPVEKYREGYYDIFYIAAYPSQLEPVERWLKLNRDILRDLRVRITRAHRDYLIKTQNLTFPENVSFARVK